jgi:PAS domain S-box-containing protein
VQIFAPTSPRSGDDATAASGPLALLRAVLDAALDCVVAIDPHGVIVDFNPAAEATFGYSRDEAIGQEMGELIVPPSIREAHRRGLQRFVDGGAATALGQRLELIAMRADQSEFPVELTITKVDVGDDVLFVGYLRDITTRIERERELRESRARIVAAADEARRRLERDLHDGAQQHLVGVALTLRLARDRVASDPAAATELMLEAAADLDTATADLRSLARGIHPAVLTEGGLRPAVRSLAGRAPLPVEVDCDGLPDHRLDPLVEATAYFVLAEGLTNVARYASAEQAWVRVAACNGELIIEVRDDGIGGADTTCGSGLAGLTDRLAALRGTLSVHSPAGRGTVLRAKVPCRTEVAV